LLQKYEYARGSLGERDRTTLLVNFPVMEVGMASSGRIPELDGLRGLAVLLVVLHHFIPVQDAESHAGFVTSLESFFHVGWTGVDLFFVLSGFLIGGILLDTRESPRYFRTFYIRRIHRIFPLYYLWIGVYFLIAYTPLVRHADVLAIAPDRWFIIPVYGFFLQNLAWSHGMSYSTPWLSTLWSLALEEHFYLVAPLVIRYCSRRRLVQLLFFVVGVSPFIRAIALHYFSDVHVAVAYVPTPCRADALAMGVLLAVAWRTERLRISLQTHTTVLWGFVVLLFGAVAGLLLTSASQYNRAMAYWGFTCLDALFSGLLLLVLLSPGGVWGRICRWRVLINLGGVSYCIYLVHQEMLAVSLRLFSWRSGGFSNAGMVAATLLAAAATWFLAKLSWRFLESPMIRRGHRFGY
jgi:peptidoglycan/LPS O-acetylase OafA/YrhL